MSEPTDAALPQLLVDKAAYAMECADGIALTGERYYSHLAEAALEAASLPALLQELRNIAFNCKNCSADDYRDWARNRARHTLRQVLGEDYEEAE